MPKRTGHGHGDDPLRTEQIYHVFNRGVDGKIVFPDEGAFGYFTSLLEHCKRFSTSLSQHAELVKSHGEEKYRLVNPSENPRGLQQGLTPVKLHAYSLMPTHFHLLVEQLITDGISEYVGRVCNSFTKAFNERFKRIGPLWQGKFKAKLISDDASYLQVIRYIHINPLYSSRLKVGNLRNYRFSSYLEAIGMLTPNICDHTLLFQLIPLRKEYERFVLAQISPSEQKSLQDLALEVTFAD